MKIAFAFAALVCAAGTAFATEAETPMSQKSAKLATGMSGCEVVGVLGQPTWIFDSKDLGEGADKPGSEWKWENAQCFPVIVRFDRKTGLVSGWDEGRSFCLDSAEEMERFLPADEFRVSEARNTGCIR